MLRLLPVIVLATVSVVADASELTLEDIFDSELYAPMEFPDITWVEEGRAYLTYETEEAGDHVWTRVDTRTGRAEEWLRLTSLGDDDAEIEGILVPEDERYLLVQTNRTKRWRYSHTDDHWLYLRDSGESSRLTEAGQEIHVQLSPDGAQIGYVQGGDLFVKNLDDDTTVALTDDGSDVIFNGDPDWVYEEEFGLLEVWWWSPDSKRIAYLHTDSAAIGAFPLMTIGEDSYPSLSMLPYPKAGSENSTVTLRVVEVATGETTDVRTLGPDDGYFARVNWIPKTSSFLVQWVNRAQNQLDLIRVDAEDAMRQTTLVTETSPGWVDVRDDLNFVDGGFLWTSERSGYRHLYRYAFDDDRLTQLTEGDWIVRSVAHASDDAAILVTTRSSHLRAQVDRFDLKRGTLTQLSADGGWHSVDVSPHGKYYLETRSALDLRPQLVLRDAKGKQIRQLVKDDMANMSGLPKGEDRFVTFTSNEGVELHGRLTLPPNFDERHTYPVLMFCYGGPGSQLVRDRWDTRNRDLFHRLMGQDGYLIFTVDGRGTGGRGRDFKSTVYRKLGQLEAVDQLAGVDYLTTLPYVDADRIGLWGWSYGGYLTAMTALRAEGRIAVGVVGAPVTDWRFYDTIYTERYMGTPQDNLEGYDAGSALIDVDRLQSRLLLIHGSADDNVHFQNSLRFMTELQNAGKPFELMVYPDKDHGVRGGTTRVHMYGTIRDFLHRHLGTGPELSVEPAGR